MNPITRRSAVLIIMMLILSQGFAQKMTPRLQRRAKLAATETLLKFKNDLNKIYTEEEFGNPEFNPSFTQKAASYFYKHDSSNIGHIHRSFIDTDDTLLRNAPELMNIEVFIDTLVSWYCNPDSSQTGVIFDFLDVNIDTLDYYMDPEILAVNLYFNVDFYGDLYAPYMEKYMRKEDAAAPEEEEDEAIFFVEDYGDDWTSFEIDAAMATFLIFRDGERFESVKLYRIEKFDPFERNIPDLREIIRPVISARNKMYLTASAGVGYSKAIAKFDGDSDFNSSSDFKLGYNVDIAFDYFYNDGPRKMTYGFSAGLGYSVYNASVSLDAYQQSFDAHSDELKKDYIKNVYAENISQDLSLNYFDLPLSFKLKYKPRNYINVYADLGVTASYLFASELEPAGNGSIRYTGTFEYDFPNGPQTVTFEDVPDYGFTTYTDLQYSEEDPRFEQFNISALIGLGGMFWVSQRWSVNMEVTYKYGLINLMDNEEQSNFILSEGNGALNNIFRNCSSLHTNAFMLNAGVSYFLKSKKNK